MTFLKSVFTAHIGKLQYSYSFKYNTAQAPTTDFPKVRHVLRLDTPHFLKLRHASVCLTSAFYMKKAHLKRAVFLANLRQVRTRPLYPKLPFWPLLCRILEPDITIFDKLGGVLHIAIRNKS